MPPTVLIASTCPPPTACAGEPRHTPAGAACRRPEQAGAGAGGPMQPFVVADVAVGERAQGSSSSNVPATCGGRPCPPSACPACPGLAAAARANPGAFSRFTTGELGEARLGSGQLVHSTRSTTQRSLQHSAAGAAQRGLSKGRGWRRKPPEVRQRLAGAADLAHEPTQQPDLLSINQPSQQSTSQPVNESTGHPVTLSLMQRVP